MQTRPAGTIAPSLAFAQKAFVVRDGCLLMVRKSESDPRHPGLWEVPGGRMEIGEDLDAHIRREVWEETGISVDPGPPFQMWQWQMRDSRSRRGDRKVNIIAVARVCEATSGELVDSNRQADDHLAEMGWIPVEDLHTYEIIPDLQPAMQDFLSRYIEEHDN